MRLPTFPIQTKLGARGKTLVLEQLRSDAVLFTPNHLARMTASANALLALLQQRKRTGDGKGATFSAGNVLLRSKRIALMLTVFWYPARAEWKFMTERTLPLRTDWVPGCPKGYPGGFRTEYPVMHSPDPIQ
eukprot:2810864-Rhodomonas_salina.1